MNSEYTKILSIVIPNWNGAKYLPELLDSIIVQTYTNWVAYIVDDQSTDESQDIVKKYSQMDQRIKLIIRDRLPKGAQTCRNIGFEMSEQSKYIIFFDSDDVIAPYCFEQRVHFMENNPNLDFSIFPAKKFSYKIDDLSNSFFGFQSEDDDLKMFWYPHIPFVVWNNIYKRSSLINLGLVWDENILSLQDSDFNMQAIIKGAKYKYSTESKIDYYWRVIPNSNSITTKIRNKSHLESHLYLFEKLFTTMTEAQKKICSLNIQMRMLVLSRFFAIDHEEYLNFTNLSWVRNNKWFAFRLKMYEYNINSKMWQFILFPILSILMRKLHKRNENKSKLLSKFYINKCNEQFVCK